MPKYDPGNVNQNEVDKESSKTLICIRHSESTWNEVVNRKLSWKTPFRAIFALSRELMLFVTSDSCLVDAPLSNYGISQSKEIFNYLRNGYLNDNKYTLDDNNKEKLRQEYISILQGDNENSRKSILVSSPLRRCIETINIGLYDRLKKNINKEQIYLLSSLQEMTRNIDGISLSSSNELPPVSWSFKILEKEFELNWDKWFENKINVSYKEGLKSSKIRGDDRMRSFFKWVFESTKDTDIIVISGHSLWFKKMFQAFLPKNFNHNSKKNKITNGGIIAINIKQYELSKGQIRYHIDPESIIPVFKNFIGSKTKTN